MDTSSSSLERVARWEQIASDISEAIAAGQLLPGARLPSETALAAQYGVCRMTAHRALHELKLLGQVDRRRRAGTTVALAPLPQLAASLPAPRIAVLTFAADDFPTIDYLRGLRDGLPPGTQILFCDTGENGELEAGYLRQMAIESDAIVCFPSAEAQNTALLQEIAAAGHPLVCLDRLPDGLEAHAILSDNYEASLTALRALAARGHRRIVHFTDDRLMVSSTRERYEAHQQALTEAGLAEPRDWVRFFNSFQQPRDQYFPHLCAAVHEVLEQMMRGPQPPTAVFCLQDAYLGAVLASCSQLGIKIPEELEIVSFNDCPPQFMPLTGPVARLIQRTRSMGELAGLLVAQILQGLFSGAPPLAPLTQRVPVQILDSSLPPQPAPSD